MYNPYFASAIIDKVILNGEMEYLKIALPALAAITIGRALLGYARRYGFDVSSSKVIVNLRKSLFDHIQTLSFSYFDEINTGELMSRIKEDTENVMHALCFGAMLFLEQIIYFVVASVILFTINWKLALVSLLSMPVIEIVVFKLERKIGAVYGRISDQRAVLNTTAQQNIAGVRVVKAFGREKHEIWKFRRENEKNYRINFDQAEQWRNTSRPSSSFPTWCLSWLSASAATL
jgi:ATP-binding cassette subfamily B multidrug efflux pump